jgi:TPR repeat protein/class 3 adenylate cyclase
VKCPNCDNENPSEASNCGSCDAALGPDASAQPEKNTGFVCVLYCDIANYVDLVWRDEHVRRLLRKYSEMFLSDLREREEVYNARIEGAQMVAAFSNATAALHYARSFQAAAEGIPHPSRSLAVKLRMGLHSGDEDAGTGMLSIASGPVGIIALDIKEAATGGEILASSAIFENVGGTTRQFFFDKPQPLMIGERNFTVYLVTQLPAEPTLWQRFKDWISKKWESLTAWERVLALPMALLVGLAANFLYARGPEIVARAAVMTSRVEILMLAGGKEAALLKRDAVTGIGNWFARTPPRLPPPPSHPPPPAPPLRPTTVCDVVSPPKDNALRACANDLESCKAKAGEGDPDAEAELGSIYLLGFGSVAKDEEQARKYATFAASHDNPVGEYTLGEIELKGSERDLADAFKRFSQAQDRYLPAKDELGYMYFNGIGTRADQKAAVKLYQEAANKKDAIGESSLAYAYLHGFGGLPVDCGNAYTYSVQAAGQGNAQALDTLGYLYEAGHCAAVAAENPSPALHCYQQAGELGFTTSQWHAGQILEHRAAEEKDPRPAEEDLQQALTWYKKAQSNGFARAQAAVERVSRKLAALPAPPLPVAAASASLGSKVTSVEGTGQSARTH